MAWKIVCRGVFLVVASLAHAAIGQRTVTPADLTDPALHARLLRPPVSRLTEEFIWTANDAAARDPLLQASVRGQDDKTEPHYFRAHFLLRQVPRVAILYIAGPRSAEVVLNGQQVLQLEDDGTRPKNLSVMTASVAAALRIGSNVIAVKEVRGHSSLHTGANQIINQVTYGEVLAVKIVPRALGVDGPPLLVSDGRWRSSVRENPNWMRSDWKDEEWPVVDSLGVLGSREDFLQWNADAGLYAWPGYTGIGRHLRIFHVPIVNAVDLKRVSPNASVLIDFGHEVSGRVRLISASNASSSVLANYGESREEAEHEKGYLGTRTIVVPPRSVAYGPKSAFRYVKLHFPARGTEWVRIDAEAITSPVRYRGSFVSSDAELNRIWATAAYTARLCMQEGIWDAPKRDRGRWMGDLDVTGRTVVDVFGERELMEQTMADIIGPSPVTRDVNTITGYSAAWITGEANLYRHFGDTAYLRKMHQPLLDLLAVMDRALNSEALFTNAENHKVFVDWSEGFSSDSAEARAATHFEFVMAYRDAAYLLNELRDTRNAVRCTDMAERMIVAAQRNLLSPSGTFGQRWQTNAAAVDAGAATEQQMATIWTHVLAHVGNPGPVITPYYGYYVLNAMAATGHSAEALNWLKSYWGGMIREGATSFWESYDPHWPKEDFHAHLQADGKMGYYVSLAHGWSSGPAVWLIEQVLGIQAAGAGFSEVVIRPQLSGLAWAHGGVPTPRGVLRVNIHPGYLKVVLPGGTHARVQPSPRGENWTLTQDGRAASHAESIADSDGTFTLSRSGVYIFKAKSSGDLKEESR